MPMCKSAKHGKPFIAVVGEALFSWKAGAGIHRNEVKDAAGSGGFASALITVQSLSSSSLSARLRLCGQGVLGWGLMTLRLSPIRMRFSTGGGRSWPFGKFQTHYNVFFAQQRFPLWCLDLDSIPVQGFAYGGFMNRDVNPFQ